MGDKWDDVLTEFLPRFSEAKDAREYHLAVAGMIARTGDTGCTIRSSLTGELLGPAMPPFEVRFIENQPVITRIFKPGSAQLGDVILKIDGQPVQNRIDELSRYVAAPSRFAMLSQVGRFLLTAKEPRSTVLTVQGKDDMPRTFTAELNDTNQKTVTASRGGEAVRLINERTGYVDLERMEISELDGMLDKFQKTAAIIFDLRGYPRGNALAIAARLGDRNQPV